MAALQQVWRYPIGSYGGTVQIAMPEGAQVVHVESRGNVPSLWAVVTPDAPAVLRTFEVYTTGASVTAGRRYLGTFILDDGAFVGHLFE